jgi:hypothetical protein
MQKSVSMKHASVIWSMKFIVNPPYFDWLKNPLPFAFQTIGLLKSFSFGGQIVQYP